VLFRSSNQNSDIALALYYRRAAFCFGFLWAEGLRAKDIHKEWLLFTVGSVSRLKRFKTGSSNSLKDVRKSQTMPYQIALLRLGQKQRPLCCGFRRTGKAMGQVYQCWWKICQEINAFFPGSNIACFTSYIHL
jgi:hypothetical protein